jgi:SAM-dependent methyltransferase
MSDGRCAACDSGGLVPHLRVAGDPGEEGLIPTTDRYGTALADIVRCPACGHMQLERFPGEEDLAEAYGEAASDDYVEEEDGQRATARRVLERIEATRGGPGSLLDLGCWVGYLLDEARARGWEVCGIEPSEFAAAFARDRLGLPVVTGGLFDTDPGQRFDAVFLGDVIEHLPRAGESLDRIRTLLTEDGLLVMALPDAGSRVARVLGARWWSVIPTHVHYFTRDSMRTILARHGFEVLSIATQPKTFSAGYYLGRLGGYGGGLARPLTAVARATGLAERQWTPDFRDRMLVIARA